MRLSFATAGLFILCVSSAYAQPLAQASGGVEVSVWRVVAALIFCLALAAGAIFALRHRLPARIPLFRAPGGERMRLVEQLSIGPQRHVFLIQVDGRDYILVSTAQGASLTPIRSADPKDESSKT